MVDGCILFFDEKHVISPGGAIIERYPGAFDYAVDPEWTTPKTVGYDMFHLVNPAVDDPELLEQQFALKRFPVLVPFPAPPNELIDLIRTRTSLCPRQVGVLSKKDGKC